MNKKDQDDSKIVAFITQVKDSLKNNLQTAFSWLDTVDGRILFNGVSTISPFIVGNPIGFFVPFILESADAIIRERFLNNLSDIGNELKQKKFDLNTDFIQSEEGQKLLKDTFRRIIQETNKEKIELQKLFLINSFTIPNPDKTFLESCMNLLKNMDLIEISVLKNFIEPKDAVDKILQVKASDEKEPVEVKILECLDIYLGVDNMLCKNALRNLINKGLIEIKPDQPLAGGFYSKNYFTGSTELVKRMKESITPFGTKFVELIISQNK